MARKKKSKGNAVGMASPSSGRNHLSVSIDDAQNGYVVNASGDSGGEYWSKKYVAKDKNESLRIASSCLAGGGKSKGGKKKGGRKKISLKKS